MIKIGAYFTFIGCLTLYCADTPKKDSGVFELKPGFNQPFKSSTELRKSSVTIYLSKENGIMISFRKSPESGTKAISLKKLSQLLKKDASRKQATVLEMKGYRHKGSQLDERVEKILKRQGYRKIIFQTGNSQGILIRKIIQNQPKEDDAPDGTDP